jgi:hypothetical protein
MSYRIIYPGGLNDYDFFGIEQKGWLEGVKIVRDEEEITLSIFDAERLAQIVREDTARLGYFASKLTVVVRSVNRTEIDLAIRRMADRDFIDVL